MPERVFQQRCAIRAHAHRWDARIFLFYLFSDIVYKVSVLINYQRFPIMNCG